MLRALIAIGVAALAVSGAATAQRTASSPCSEPADKLEVTEFGAKGDGTTDNLQAFRAAMAYAAKCHVTHLHVGAGTYSFVSPGAGGGILVASGVVLDGDGADKTVLKVAAGEPGANFDSLLWIRNQDRVEIRDMRFVGNNIVVNNPAGQPLNTYGSAISVVVDAGEGKPAYGAPRNLSHVVIAHDSFENFNGAAWIRVINYHDSFHIDDVEISDNRFVSFAGNAVNGASIAYPSNAISVAGSRTSADGLVTNVRVLRNNIDATHLKGGVSIWSGVRGIVVADNRIDGAGADAAIPNDRGAYAITVYNNAYYYDKDHPRGALLNGIRPDDVHIERNVIRRPRSCGIYVASANRVWIVGNDISGQSDPENKTLPKGGIVLNYPLDANVTGNRISSSRIGMTLLSGDRYHIMESDNSIVDVPPGGARTLASRGAPPSDL